MAIKKEDKEDKNEKVVKTKKTSKTTKTTKVAKTVKPTKAAKTSKTVRNPKTPKEEQPANKSPFLTYKGKPLVRCGDTLYYGNMTDDYVVMINIEGKTEENNLMKANKLFIQLLSTRTDIDIQKRIIKTSRKENMYLAMDLADIWLTRALSQGDKTEEKN